MQTQTVQAKFYPGDICITRAAMEKMPPEYAGGAILQHLQGKWGILDRQDWDANERALKDGGRLLSVYPLPDESGDFWIITEAADENGQRSVTTLLLPSDY